MRHPDFGGETNIMMISGSTIPFPWFYCKNDPRKSVEERYSNKEYYLKLVKEYALDLVKKELILPMDVETSIEDASRFWDWLETQE